jgi:YidC/Oxa1 family membrane protein insertase
VLALIAAVATISARRTHRQNRALSWLPYLSVAFAAFMPLAAGVYVLVTTAWSALETAVLRRQPAQPVTQPAG